jgi:hypothetical protein
LFERKNASLETTRRRVVLRPVISSGASGHRVDDALTNFLTVEDQRTTFEQEHVAAIRAFG